MASTPPMTCIYRPCNETLFADIQVTMKMSVPGQLTLSPDVLLRSHFSDKCKASVEVAALDDNFSEGDHYVNIQHFVNSINGGNGK